MCKALEWLGGVAFALGFFFFKGTIACADRVGKKKIVPPSAGLRPEPRGYIEPARTEALRVAYVARRATREDILAAEDHKRAMALIRDAGGC